MANIIKLFLNGIQAKLGKEVLADDVVSQLLPQVTSEDAGKTLVVDQNGQLVLQRVSTNFIVTLTESSMGRFNSDKTYQEVLDAYNAGDEIIFQFQGFKIIPTFVDNNFTGMGFYPYDIRGELFVANVVELLTVCFIMGENDGETVVQGGIGASKFLPVVSSDDNGKFLKVASGTWAVSN